MVLAEIFGSKLCHGIEDYDLPMVQRTTTPSLRVPLVCAVSASGVEWHPREVERHSEPEG